MGQSYIVDHFIWIFNQAVPSFMGLICNKHDMCKTSIRNTIIVETAWFHMCGSREGRERQGSVSPFKSTWNTLMPEAANKLTEFSGSAHDPEQIWILSLSLIWIQNICCDTSKRFFISFQIHCWCRTYGIVSWTSNDGYNVIRILHFIMDGLWLYVAAWDSSHVI